MLNIKEAHGGKQPNIQVQKHTVFVISQHFRAAGPWQEGPRRTRRRLLE